MQKIVFTIYSVLYPLSPLRSEVQRAFEGRLACANMQAFQEGIEGLLGVAEGLSDDSAIGHGGRGQPSQLRFHSFK